MVAGDLGVDLSPEPFEEIVIGGIGRKEVKIHATSQGFHRAPELTRLVRLVEAPVVRGEVNGSVSAEGREHFEQEVDEEGCVALVAPDLGGFATADVHGASNVALDVRAGRHDFALPAPEHPVGPDLGIESDVDFVGPEGPLIRRQILGELSDLSESSGLLGLGRLGDYLRRNRNLGRNSPASLLALIPESLLHDSRTVI